MDEKTLHKIVDEYRGHFSDPQNSVPNPKYADERGEYVEWLRRLLKFMEEYSESEVCDMFDEYIKSGGSFFPTTGQLLKYKPVQEPKEKDAFGHVPSAKETAEYIRRQEEMIQRAKELDNEETRERLAEIHEEIRRKLEKSAGKDSDGTARKFGTVRVDFDSE